MFFTTTGSPVGSSTTGRRLLPEVQYGRELEQTPGLNWRCCLRVCFESWPGHVGLTPGYVTGDGRTKSSPP